MGNNPTKAQVTWVGLALCHLIVVFVAGFGLEPSFLPARFTDIVSVYAAYSGAGTGYGFFSPNIPNQIIARVEMRHGDTVLRAKLFENNRNEAELRLSGLALLLMRVDRADLAAKLIAAHCFGVVDDVETITVSLEYFIVPTLADYRNGAPDKYLSIYEAEFSRESLH